VLLAVVQLGGGAYAVAVRDEIGRRTSRSVSRGAVYVTLDRLQRKGLLRSELGDPTPERGGKAKRIFTLESGGVEALQESLSELRRMADGLDGRLSGVVLLGGEA
jgi:DNA-binding PadR family transcriptional regulator